MSDTWTDEDDRARHDYEERIRHESRLLREYQSTKLNALYEARLAERARELAIQQAAERVVADATELLRGGS